MERGSVGAWGQAGFELRLISSLAMARTRDALYNFWDKNDPKDAQVLLHLLKGGVTQRYHDPLVHAANDLQELAQAHFQISLRKTRVQHSMLTHYLPLYFPEAERYYTQSRAVVQPTLAPVSMSGGDHALLEGGVL